MSTTFPCVQCGAQVEYAPGTTALKCPYCGTTQALPDTGRSVQEHSYAQWAAAAITTSGRETARTGAHVFECQNCKATTESDDVSRRCPFCGSPLVREVGGDALVAPEGIVAFEVDKPAAQAAIARWIRSRRFAPNALRTIASTEALAGTYLPFWTFDAPTRTDYDGQRGEHYWVSETYTTMVDGRPQTQTRQVQKTAGTRPAAPWSANSTTSWCPRRCRSSANDWTGSNPGGSRRPCRTRGAIWRAIRRCATTPSPTPD